MLTPSLRSELTFRAILCARLGRHILDLNGTIAEVRPGNVRTEGALEVAPAAVDGRIGGEGGWHFRETWLLVRPVGSAVPWRLWRAEPMR